jgi:predicted Zn-dependent protease
MVSRVPLSLIALVLTASIVTAQTPVVAPSNRFKPADDVRLGREASAEVTEQLPLLRDNQVRSTVASIGRRLVSAIPEEFRHPEFRYSFEVVNVRDINAFALPGGPIYVNRGMLEAADDEGEIAGVLAHEISHVALRHGTAQASRATKYQIGMVAGAIIGSLIGGKTGNIVSQGTQLGLGTAFLRFGREFERQADTLGAQIMARAGYDPREMADMFKTLEREGRNGGPEWLSDHPNPGNRYEAISREAEMLPVNRARGDSPAFAQMEARLDRLPDAPTTEQVARARRR